MPDSDRRYRVGRSFIEASDISFRLQGAEYHLGVVRDIVEQEIIGRPADELPDLSRCKMHWHIAGFFWELIATFDCALQAVVAHHRLPIPRHNISWQRVGREIQRREIADPLLDKLSEVQTSDWLQDANAIRIYMTHWGPAFIQGLSSHGKVVSIKVADQVSPVDVWAGYVENMRELVDTAVRALPSGHIRFQNTD